jgi:hypothetical protein
LSATKNGLIVLFFISIIACVKHDVKLPAGYISEQNMVPIMVDIHLIEGARSGKLVLGDTNSLPDYYAKIYEKHNVTEAEFKQSFAWYTEHPEKLKSVYEEVIVSLSKLEEEVNARKKPRDPEDDYEETISRPVDSLAKRAKNKLHK